jgi:capsid protein
MKILGFHIPGTQKEVKADNNPRATAYNSTIIPLNTRVLSFDGERNIGEMGPATNYIPNYYVLSTRSYQAYMDSPLAKTVIDKWVNWIIDSGLKAKANPSKVVLESEGIKMSKDDREAYNDVVEARWNIWANSKHSSHTGEETFNETSKSIYLNSKIGGDILVVLRYENDIVKVQQIDGARIKTPFGKSEITDTKNIISNGVKLSPKGEVLGYYVQKGVLLEFDFIPAYSKESGLRTAFLVKGSKWRLDYHRGLPVIATALETLSKIDRYREATVGSAEEVAKISWQVVHQNFSDGSNPMQQGMARAFNADGSGDLPTDDLGQALADRIAVTTNKTAYNNPKGAKIEPVNQSSSVSGFDEFYTPQTNIICACVGIPPNVAMSMYNDSFSASRAATKDWDHTMDIERVDFDKQCLSYIYKFWLYTETLKNKIPAVGYLQAFNTGNIMITESYEKVRFTGSHFPHIDPVKEVKAEREKLGALGVNEPLTTVKKATENLGTGDSDANRDQFSDELEKSKELGIIEKEEPAQQIEPED